MRYISICSGIEAATVAWRPLGWEAVAFAEIEAFPNDVLAHHYPTVPNLGDITKVDWRPYAGAVDLVVGGTPCQSFSVAGKREGMDGASGLVREYFRLLSEVKPRWFLWENVPGVLSDKGNAFQFILNQWHKLGYNVSYRILDAQYFGVAQRRRRVFAIGHLADWRYPAKVLFEWESVCGNPAPRREKREANSSCSQGSSGTASHEGISYTLNTVDRHAVAECYPIDLRSLGKTKKEDLPVGEEGSPAYTLTKSFTHGVAFCTDVSPTLSASGPPFSRSGNDYVETEALVCQEPLVLKDREGKPGGGKGLLIGEDKSFTLSCGQDQAMFHQEAVRRLTPTECERLQGFSDGYTDVPFRGKPAPDSARYKALGNSMCVNVMRWIGQRIQMVEDEMKRCDRDRVECCVTSLKDPRTALKNNGEFLQFNSSGGTRWGGGITAPSWSDQ